MTRYHVDSEAVLATTGAVHATIERLHSECAGLYALLAQLEASWSGGAATAFSGVVQDWRATQQLVEQNLASINRALGLAGQQYADIEASNTRLFTR